MPTDATIDDYIAGFPEAVRVRLLALRATIRAHAPEAEERISYRMPTFHLNGNLVHFAAFERHLGFYPGSTGIAAFRPALARCKSANGSVQFPHDEPLPLELVAAIVEFRVAENGRTKDRGRRAWSAERGAARVPTAAFDGEVISRCAQPSLPSARACGATRPRASWRGWRWSARSSGTCAALSPRTRARSRSRTRTRSGCRSSRSPWRSARGSWC
jgi:uncharacterized protein YdhG (YjbR/CyaY superfamily)